MLFSIPRLLRPTGLLLLLALQSMGTAQAAAQPVAVVRSLDMASFDEVLESFVKNCPGQVVDFNLKGKKGNGKRIAERIKAADAKVVVAIGLLAARVVKEELPGIPLLYCMVSNPHRYGLIGENTVGISLDVPGEKQFPLFKSVVPDLKTIGVLYDPEKSGILVADAAEAARSLGVELLPAAVSSRKKVPEALRGMLGKIDVLWMVPDDTVLTTDSFRFLLVTSFENRLPLMAISDIFVRVGALASIIPDPGEVGRQVCELIARYDRGELNLSAVDVVPPTVANLVINVKTAEKIGLSISAEVLASASKIYK